MKKTIIFLAFFFSLAVAVMGETDYNVTFINCDDSVADQWGNTNPDAYGFAYNTSYPTFQTSGDGSPKSTRHDGNNDWINITPASGVVNTNQGSLTFWFNPGWSSGDSTNRMLYGAGAANDYIIAQHFTDNNWYIGFRSGGSVYRMTIAAASLSVSRGTWYHWAFVWDVASTTQRVYLNGVEKGSKTDALAISSISQPFYFGSDYNQGSDYLGNFDHIKFYNKSLNTTEINNSYHRGIRRYFESGGDAAATPLNTTKVNMTSDGGQDCSWLSEDSWNCTTQTEDTTPTFIINTSVNAWCKINNVSANYSSMAGAGATAGNGTMQLTLTLPSASALSEGKDYVYIACANASSGGSDEQYQTIEMDVNNPDSCTYSSGNWVIEDKCNITNTNYTVCPNYINITSTGWLNVTGNSHINASMIYWAPSDAQESFRLMWELDVSRIYWGGC